MKNSITYNTTVLQLPDDLTWTDEHTWQSVEQQVTRTLSGGLLIESHARVGGRPITLAPPDDNSAWMMLQDLQAISVIANIPDAKVQLKIGNYQFDAMFRHHDGEAVSAKPVVFFSDAVSTDFYLVTLKLMAV